MIFIFGLKRWKIWAKNAPCSFLAMSRVKLTVKKWENKKRHKATRESKVVIWFYNKKAIQTDIWYLQKQLQNLSLKIIGYYIFCGYLNHTKIILFEKKKK